MLRAYVVTIPKPRKDPITPANFQPISVLNLDVKIFAKLLAKRLMTVLPTLIKKDHMGFVKTSDVTKRILNIIQYAEKTQTSSLLLSIDAGKVFDRVYWHYMSIVLSKFGFQGTAILPLYLTPSTQVYTSGNF